MSYILEALKRAERDRKQGQVSVLDELPAAQTEAEPTRRLRGWLPALAAVGVLALLIGGVLAWRHHGGKDAAAPPPALAAAIPAAPAVNDQRPPQLSATPPPAVTPPQAQQPASAQTPAATIEDGGKIATLDDVAGAAQAPGPPPGPPPGRQTAPQAGQPTAAAPAPAGPVASAPVAALPPPANDSAPADMAQSPPEAAPDAGVAGAPEAAPPPPAAAQQPAGQRQLREMPENFRANFPAFTVDVHAYNDKPQKRFVLVSGKRYHEGDTLAEGPRIVSIVPEGIVFDWQGQQVLYAIAR